MYTNLLNDFIENTKNIMINNILVLKDGEEIAAYNWEPEIRQNQYSVSKSFTSSAMGIAVGEGLLTLDDPVIDFLPEKVPDNPPDRLRRLKVRHLLTMGVGHDESHLMAEQRYTTEETDWVRLSLAIPMDFEPGARFVYSNVGPYLAGMIIRRLTGSDLRDYLMPRLFEPLGIWLPTWETDPLGNSFGSGGLMLKVSEIAKLGQLYLQGGQWEGKQLIPKQWVEEVSKTLILTGADSPHNAG
ncbi:MAG TPA: serine hydrolase, partial [Clostridia bacterium]|nr:serine hydrolase [Clostridia bacterium]